MLVFCLLEKSERTASDNLQNPWSRGTPSMLFSNCIVSSDCCIRLPSIFGPIETNFERNSDEMFPFTEIFQFTKNNLINNPPNFLDADVKLEFTGYELQLLPDSPGRNQAHDGTHLGAWQGDTL
jgi:hypothetical protein